MYDVCYYAQVVLATSVTYAADLSDRTNLTVVADQGGIPPGKWYGVRIRVTATKPGDACVSQNSSLSISLLKCMQLPWKVHLSRVTVVSPKKSEK